MSSETAHKSFDRLSGTAENQRRRRGDRISGQISERLRAGLSSEPIKKVCALVDTRIAHTDHSEDLSAPHLNASLDDDVAAAYKALVGMRNFPSAVLLGDALFASAVPVPQYDISAALDEPSDRSIGRDQPLRRFWRARGMNETDAPSPVCIP
jgi:hypothetical protein